MWTKEYRQEYNRQYVQKRRLDLIKKLGGKCVSCGQTRSNLLVFHHKRKVPKNKHKSGCWWFTYDPDKIELLCEYCHTSKHGGLAYRDKLWKETVRSWISENLKSDISLEKLKIKAMLELGLRPERLIKYLKETNYVFD